MEWKEVMEVERNDGGKPLTWRYAGSSGIALPTLSIALNSGYVTVEGDGSGVNLFEEGIGRS